MGDIRAAELDAAFARERVADTPRSDVELQAIQAVLHLRKSQQDTAISNFRDAVDMAQWHDLPSALLTIPVGDLRALAQLAYDTRRPALLERLLAAVPDDAPATPVTAKLSARELVVLHTLDAHPTDSIADIARRLDVSRNTIKSQLLSIYRKVGAPDRETALQRLRESGVLPSHDAPGEIDRKPG